MRIDGIGLLRIDRYNLMSIYDKKVVLKNNDGLTIGEDIISSRFDDEFKKMSSKEQLKRIIDFHTSRHFINRYASGGIDRVVFSSGDVEVAVSGNFHDDVVNRLAKEYRNNRKKVLFESMGCITNYSFSYSPIESSFGLDKNDESLDFVLISDFVDGDEELADLEVQFFQYAIDKIFGNSIIRLSCVVEEEGITQCSIEDGYVTRRGVVDRKHIVDVSPAMVDIARRVVYNHNCKVRKIKPEVKQYKKIRESVEG